MSDSQWPVQEAIYAALRANATIKSLVGDPARVYDHVEQNPTFPFITIGESTAVPFDTKTTFGTEQTLTLHAWDRNYRGRKRVKQILKAIYDVLHDGQLTVDSNEFIYCYWEFSDTFVDPDGLTYHGVARYRVVTQE